MLQQSHNIRQYNTENYTLEFSTRLTIKYIYSAAWILNITKVLCTTCMYACSCTIIHKTDINTKTILSHTQPPSIRSKLMIAGVGKNVAMVILKHNALLVLCDI